MNNWDIGKKGEDLALEEYQKRGYRLLFRNFQYYNQGSKGRLGEIDLIVEKGGLICMVEVKTRSSEVFGKVVEQITKSKLAHLYKTYQYFLMKNPQYRNSFCRFDVASVLNNNVEIHENAYSFDGLF